MLTQQTIDDGVDRLVDGKLIAVDVSALSSIFDMTFSGTSKASTYDYDGKLAELDDTGNERKLAAQVAGCLIKLQELEFTGAQLQGAGGGLNYSANEEYLRYVLFAFSKIYPVPVEFSRFDMGRARFFNSRRVSGQVDTYRGS